MKELKYGKDIIYGVCIIFYLTGLLFLLDFLFKFQNVTFKNPYYSLLYPIVAIFLISFYVSLLKLLKKITKPNVKFKKGNINKMLYLLTGIIILLLLSIKFSFNPYNFTTMLAFIGYIISLAFGFQLIKVIDNPESSTH